GFAVDLDQREVADESAAHRVRELLHLRRAPEQPERAGRALNARWADRSREQGLDVLAADHRGLERTGLGGRLEAELLVESGPEAPVASQGLVLPPERVEGEHLQAVRTFAEAVERRGRFGVGERRREVMLGEGRVCGVEAGAEHASVVAATKVDGPGRVRLVLEHLAVYEPERLFERGAGEARRFAC